MQNIFTKHKILALSLMLISGLAFAEGSKDLYPAGTTSHRLMLEPVGSDGTPSPIGHHYVYAKAGEKITLATNNINSGNSWIKLFAPNGSEVVYYTKADFDVTGLGRIGNRTQELAGPRLSASDTTPNRYAPVVYTVPAGGDGIYKVDWRGPGTTMPGAVGVHLADNSDLTVPVGEWNPALNSRRFIAGWDISVINPAGTAFIPGRVYLYSFRSYAGSGASGVTQTYEIGDIRADFRYYVRTFDGYTYIAKTIGSYGIYSRFFSNKNGLHHPVTNAPTYKSKNSTGINSGNTQHLHDPDTADTPVHKTNKMFYSLPNNDMPLNSIGAVPGGSTWLRTPAVTTGIITDLKIKDANGLDDYIGYGGGAVSFNSTIASNGTVTIKSNTLPPAFATVEFPLAVVAGYNEIEWDGTDGDGNPIPQGFNDISITAKLVGGEVHFPMSDVEVNKGGLIIEQLDPTAVQSGIETIVSDIVWWDDSLLTHTNLQGDGTTPVNNSHLLPTSSAGISSNTNGHRWGANLPAGIASGTWGDSKFIDTWTFVQNGLQQVTAIVFVPCYNPATNTGQTRETRVGITLLKRAGADNSVNWPMSRRSGHIALESNSKGFVVTRVATTAALSAITTPQEGMMVYDGEAKCLKIYTDGAWKCFNRPDCP